MKDLPTAFLAQHPKSCKKIFLKDKQRLTFNWYVVHFSQEMEKEFLS